MRTVFRIFLILVLLAATVYFNVGLVDIRLQEMSYLIGQVAARQDVPMSLGIVAKYELIRKRMDSGESSEDAYELEARMQALISGDQFKNEERSVTSTILRAPVRVVISTIRFALGKPIINPQEEDKIIHVLEIGYFWERNRKYQEAIGVYNQVLAMSNIAPDILSAVLIHKGFCHSMLGEYDAAKQMYERVITMYPNTDAGVLAWRLIDFIESMEKQRLALEQKTLSDMDRAKQFFRVMDYRNAIKFFSKYMGTNPAEQLKHEALFYKGRAHEELGESEEAMMSYQRVIRDDKSREWAKQANRRMFMIGEFYDRKKQVSDEAKKQLAAYKDQNFITSIEQYSGMVSESSLRRELLKETGAPASARSASGSDSVLNMINKIGSLDLTGEKEAKKREDLEKMRSELIAQGKLNAAEIREVERRRALEDNPFRRPSAIKAVIEENSSQLKYIYNRRLRQGDKISGRMIVEIKILASGGIGNVSLVKSSMGDNAFETEILKQISQWKFKSVSEDLGPMTVNYPIDFSEEE